jgi:hypothetical protein
LTRLQKAGLCWVFLTALGLGWALTQSGEGVRKEEAEEQLSRALLL